MSMRRAAKAVAQAAARASRPDVAIAPARYPRHRYLSDMPGSRNGDDGYGNRLWNAMRGVTRVRARRAFASSVGDAPSTAGGGIMIQSGHPSSHPQVLVVPLERRPLMPGVIMPVRIFDEKLIAELEEMKSRGQAYVGAFLKKSDATGPAAVNAAAGDAPSDESLNWDPSDDMHDVGTFAQVNNIIRIVDYKEDEDDGDGDDDEKELGAEGKKKGGAAKGKAAAAGAPGAKKKKSGDDAEEGGVTLLLLGHHRLRKTQTMRSDPMVVGVEHLKDKPHKPAEDDDVLKATANEVIATIKDLLKVNPMAKETLQYFAQRFSDFQDPAKLADLATSMCSADDQAMQDILSTVDVRDRLNKALTLLKKEVELGKLQADIGRRVEEKISGDQRKYFLMEQLKSIKKELGMERDDKTALAEKFAEKFAAFRDQAPAHAVKTIEEELQKLSGLEPSSSEFNVTRNYLEWLTSIPWGHSSEERLDITEASKVLDDDHYGLEDVKERILEFIAVGQLRGTTQGKIITLVGPPGVGKTSIGQSIARALDRKFFRFSVGGLSDVAEIKGHRRTYVGAMPGKLVQCLKSTGVDNPVVLIDEVDKLGRGYQGDPASALLELLDPEQNGSFLDHYLDVPVDLSKVLFVCTANVLDTIPGPLLDRMEVVRLSGYIADEKNAIARRYLEKNAKERSGVGESEASITDQAMKSLIEDYCREAGVRNLQKHLEKIYRKVALKLAKSKGPEASKRVGEARAKVKAAMKNLETKEAEHKKVAASAKSEKILKAAEEEVAEAKQQLADAENGVKDAIDASAVAGEHAIAVDAGKDLIEYVGQPPFQTDRIYETTPPGVVTGLAWTSMGGSTLYIECTAVQQNVRSAENGEVGGGSKGGTLKTTGQLGDVMKESTTIAHTYARAFLQRKHPGNTFFDDTALHVHVPAGSTPKDGPSAGCTMITAMVSLATGKPVRPNLAMTGEVTLTGIVMPIGGVKEKTIAARRSGVTTILFPEGNRRDYDELSDEVKRGIEVHFVSTYDEVYEHALGWDEAKPA